MAAMKRDITWASKIGKIHPGFEPVAGVRYYAPGMWINNTQYVHSVDYNNSSIKVRKWDVSMT